MAVMMVLCEKKKIRKEEELKKAKKEKEKITCFATHLTIIVIIITRNT